jgi:hypothetical protein
MQMAPMIYNWAQYGGICARATSVLPQCSILSLIARLCPMSQELTPRERALL